MVTQALTGPRIKLVHIGFDGIDGQTALEVYLWPKNRISTLLRDGVGPWIE